MLRIPFEWFEFPLECFEFLSNGSNALNPFEWFEFLFESFKSFSNGFNVHSNASNLFNSSNLNWNALNPFRIVLISI